MKIHIYKGEAIPDEWLIFILGGERMSKLWGYQIPNINEPYVYLQSLITDPYSPSKHVANWATYLLEDNLYKDEDTMYQRYADAFSFLKEVAEIQRQHEYAFIQARIKDIKSIGNLGDETQEIIDQLESMLKGDSAFNYQLFISGLNTVINSIEKYKSRLKGFKNKQNINTPQLNLVQQLQATIGDLVDRRKQFSYSQEEIIRQLTIEFLNQYGGNFIASQLTANGATNIAAAMALIQRQLAQYLYDQGMLKYTKEPYISPKAFEEDYKRILNLTKNLSQFAQDTNIKNVFNNQQLLDDVKKLYGITLDERQLIYSRQLGRKAVEAERLLKQTLGNDPSHFMSQELKDSIAHVKVTWQPQNNALSFEDELVSAISTAWNSHVHLGRGQRGTDMILGKFISNHNTPFSSDPVAETLKNIETSLAEKGVGHDAEQISNIYIEQLTQLEKKLENLGKSFILHETTKSYNALERGQWPKDMKSFSGREMKMTNYINSIAQMGNITGIDTQWLQFACLNLATDALGATLKEPMENFLAIFGGIIMFDDFAIIGREVTEKMHFSNIENLHLYRLQDIYVPASFFLDATYNVFQKLGSDILDGMGFTATIKVPTIDYYNNYQDQSFKQKWSAVKETAEKNTSIHLHFAANFLSFMSKL